MNGRAPADLVQVEIHAPVSVGGAGTHQRERLGGALSRAQGRPITSIRTRHSLDVRASAAQLRVWYTRCGVYGRSDIGRERRFLKTVDESRLCTGTLRECGGERGAFETVDE